jgi:broad-specificity NMP kinase
LKTGKAKTSCINCSSFHSLGWLTLSRLSAISSNSKYKANKIQENVSAEIMEVISAETRESYEPEIVVELRSDGLVDNEMDDNVRRIEEWCANWIKNSAERELAEGDGAAEESDE